MVVGAVADPYVYPGTGILRNLLDLKDAQTLAQLAALRLEGAYDLPHLQGFHRFIFQDVYAWAGELRRVPLAKPGGMFALPEHVEGYAASVLRQLAQEHHLRGLSREQFVERLAYYYAEINAVHPFREGNGRAERAFLRQLALDAGHTLGWESLDANRLVYASQLSFQGDNLPMRDLIDRAVDVGARDA